MYKYPLGIMKQVVMKLESVTTDLYEIMEDPDLNDDDRQELDVMVDVSQQMMAHIVNMIREECGEEDFLDEDIDMDEIGIWPGDEAGESSDLLDQTIELE